LWCQHFRGTFPAWQIIHILQQQRGCHSHTLPTEPFLGSETAVTINLNPNLTALFGLKFLLQFTSTYLVSLPPLSPPTISHTRSHHHTPLCFTHGRKRELTLCMMDTGINDCITKLFLSCANDLVKAVVLKMAIFVTITHLLFLLTQTGP
jgi:hypothetical protein